MKTDGRLLDQFASTFKEWHYLVGGFSTGFVSGVLVALWFVLRALDRYEGSRT